MDAAARDRDRPDWGRVCPTADRRGRRRTRLRPDRVDRRRRHHAGRAARRRGRRPSGARDRVREPGSACHRHQRRPLSCARTVQPRRVAAATIPGPVDRAPGKRDAVRPERCDAGTGHRRAGPAHRVGRRDAVRSHGRRRSRGEHADRDQRLCDLRRRSASADPRRRLRVHAPAQARRIRARPW